MTFDRNHIAYYLEYLKDGIVLATAWLWQQVLIVMKVDMDLDSMSQFGEVADRVMKFAITVLVLVTAWLRYKNEKKKGKKPDA